MHAPAPVPPPRSAKWHDRLSRSGFFFAAVLFHLFLFLLIATIVIWKAPLPPPNDDFYPVGVKVPPPPVQPPATGQAASNPQFEPQQVSVPVVAPPSAITTANSSAFAINSSKILSQAASHTADQLSRGSGLSTSGGGAGNGSGNGPASSFFGSLAQGTTLGFEGQFHDFTRAQDGSTTPIDEPTYANTVRAFCEKFQPPEKQPCYTSNVTLFSKFFFFPPIPDYEAGAAFKTPSSTEAFWIAHYHGSFTVDTRGEYRLVGFGDNVCEVRINDRVVLDASDLGYLGSNQDYEGPTRKHVGDILLPGKDSATPVFMGDSFIVEPGDTVHVDIAMGDEGGIFCAGLFLTSRNPTLTFSSTGIPLLPLFGVGSLNESDKQLLSQYLPPECLVSTANFTVVKEDSK